MNKFAIWFRWAVIVGILQDWFFAFAGLLIPNAVLHFAGMEPAIYTVWPALACATLLLLSVAYIPGAIDPFRYSLMAFFTVVARLGGVLLFFIVYPRAFPALFGYIDLVLTFLQGTLLALTFYVGPQDELQGEIAT